MTRDLIEKNLTKTETSLKY